VTESIAFARELPFGLCVGVNVPSEDDAGALERLAETLDPAEREHARGLAAARRATWIGGRAALRAALEQLGIAAGPVLATPRGAPALPAGVVASISHKRTIAVALAARVTTGDETLGIDIELDRAPRQDISRRVLTPAEREALAALDPALRARAVLSAFSAKEAIYKAVDPWLRRSVSFQEVELTLEIGHPKDGMVGARFTPRAGEPDFAIELHEELELLASGLVVMAARVQRRAG
jgi:4'-phosphopantetheinyl transferase EntD